MNAITSYAGSISRGLVVAAAPVTQTAAVGFSKSATRGFDLVARLRDARVGAQTTQLTVNLALQAGQEYFLRSASLPAVGAMKAELVDANGNRQSLDFGAATSVAFSVASSGQYQLEFTDSVPLKKQVDRLTVEAKILQQTANLSFARRFTYDADAALDFKDAKLGANANQLTVSLNLNAGQQYKFASSAMATSGPLAVTLIDAGGNESTLDPSRSFSVARAGQYQLRIARDGALKSVLDAMSLTTQVVLPTSSGDARIDALVRGGTRSMWNNGDSGATPGTEAITPGATALAGKGTPNVVTFGFFSSAQGTAQDKQGFKVMTKAQKEAVRRSFAYYGKLINVTFKEVNGNGAGDINFGTNNQGGVSAGYSYGPKTGPVTGKTSVMLANDQWTSSDSQVQEGGYGYEVLLHEIGHALGLKHPGNYNAGGGGAPGPFLSAEEDNRERTIMSYHDNTFSAGVNPTSAMVYDVAALQYLYGANKSASTATNGAFAFTAGKKYLQTLWSANGTDTIDLSGLANKSYVDLNAGAYSSINIIGPATSPSYSGNGNVGIAYGARINNVKLSSLEGVAETVALNDAFASGAFDRIEGFNAAEDKIALKQSLFSALSADNIEFGAEATRATSNVIVNSDTGEIFYDADGSGAAAAKKIAQYAAYQGHGQLTASNFQFVA